MANGRLYVNLVCSFVTMVTFSAPPAASAARPVIPPTQQFTLSAPSENSEIRSVTTRVAEVDTDDDRQLELALEQVIDGHDISSVTTLVPDDSSRVRPSYFARAARAVSKVTSAVKQKAVISTARFGEWFISSRVQIIAFEITLMSGMKLTELLIGPQHAALAPALSASLLIGGIIGYVEWYTPQLVRMYTNHNSFVKNLISKLNAKASSPEIDKRLRDFNAALSTGVNKGYWFLKNASLNTLLYVIFKTILYASLKADGLIYERVVEGAQMFSMFDLGMSFALGFGATGAGMPTSAWIVRHKEHLIAEAGSDPVKLARADNLLTLWWSTALTARAAAFSSLLVGFTLDWPGLMLAAGGAIATMSGGSWIINRRHEKRECERLLTAGSE